MSTDKNLMKHDQGDQLEERLTKLAPAVDIYENEQEILLYADLPGVAKNDITIDIDDGKLSLSGRRTCDISGARLSSEFGSALFERNFSISKEIDVAKINATLDMGVLILHLPRSASARPRKIEIQSPSNSVH